MIPSRAFEARESLKSKLATAKEVYNTMIAVIISEGLTIEDLSENQKYNLELLSDLIASTEDLLNTYGTVN